MKLQFDANQEYQLDAIKATVDLFAGQPVGVSDFSFAKATGIGGTFLSVVSNNLIVDEETVLDNLKSVQKVNGIDESAELDGLHFSIEMETGTGKTYVYLRAIHELYETYGFKKFIIVVPSLAIKEGTLKNLEITKEHFELIYNIRPDFYLFDPKKRGLARNFATTNTLQIHDKHPADYGNEYRPVRKGGKYLLSKKRLGRSCGIHKGNKADCDCR